MKTAEEWKSELGVTIREAKLIQADACHAALTEAAKDMKRRANLVVGDMDEGKCAVRGTLLMVEEVLLTLRDKKEN